MDTSHKVEKKAKRTVAKITSKIFGVDVTKSQTAFVKAINKALMDAFYEGVTTGYYVRKELFAD